MPFLARHDEADVRRKPMFRRKCRMQKFIRELHVKALHQSSARQIGFCREGDDAIKSETFKTYLQCGGCCFRGESSVLERHGQAPTDFDLVRVEAGSRDADKAGESGVPSRFSRFCCLHVNCPESEAVASEVVLDSVEEAPAFIAREWRRKELHDRRIGIELVKWFDIGRRPSP